MQTHELLGLNPQGFHRIVYHEWGNPLTPHTLLCLHGLTRNSRDFDFLAETLLPHYHTFAPDMAGRGQSDWLPTPACYQLPQYLNDIIALMARMQTPTIDLLGTSMGGLLGIILAAQPNTPIRRLILNDIGPFISQQALLQMGSDLKNAYKDFANLAELEAFLRKEVYPNAGSLTEAHWQHITRYSSRLQPNGTYARAYDPNLLVSLAPFLQAPIDLWQEWERIKCPVLVLRGTRSDMLSPETCEKMLQSKSSQVTLIELPDIGHPPFLMVPEQMDPIKQWLQA